MIGEFLLVEQPQTEPQQATFAEAVKLARSRPERGLERNDLLVKDDVLEPHWHWSRQINMSREEAIDIAQNAYLEQVMLVGDEMKLKSEKPEKKQKIDLSAASGDDLEPIPEPSAPRDRGLRIGHTPLEVFTYRVSAGEVFMALFTVAFAFLLHLPVLQILILIAANCGLLGAAVAGRITLARRRSRMRKKDAGWNVGPPDERAEPSPEEPIS